MEEEAANRSSPVTLALPMIVYGDIDDFDEIIVDELYKNIRSYVDSNYSLLSEKQKINLVHSIHGLTKSSASQYNIFDDEIRNIALWNADTNICHPYLYVGIDDESFTLLIREIEDGKLEDYRSYEIDDPLVVSTIEALSIETAGTLLYTFNVLLGKTYRIVNDFSNGAYPLLNI